ncbi:hypothetical protein DPF_2297 [Desulfoplanes formicivorans]|uniref:Uncharacterized protein n=1 Tax=Desulfoplanes formicivorans TaxID=1592317 RepID=A0A194AJS5_9BACT|nr:hypothetical protein DPF_2297 [Desulfoplanes formicivorans]
MKNVVRIGTDLPAGVHIPDISRDKGKTGPLIRSNQVADIFEIVVVAGGKIVQSHDLLIKFEQAFKKVGTDEAGNAGDDPGSGIAGKVVCDG